VNGDCPHPGDYAIAVPQTYLADELAELSLCALCRGVAYILLAGQNEDEPLPGRMTLGGEA
jgi:hypothetical protein